MIVNNDLSNGVTLYLIRLQVKLTSRCGLNFTTIDGHRFKYKNADPVMLCTDGTMDKTLPAKLGSFHLLFDTDTCCKTSDDDENIFFK